MTTLRWMIVVAYIAAWLGFVARAERLRGLGASHLRQFSAQKQGPDVTDGGRSGAGSPAGARAAWHLKMATEFNTEADFVESFHLALILSGVVFAVALGVRDARGGWPVPLNMRRR